MDNYSSIVQTNIATRFHSPSDPDSFSGADRLDWPALSLRRIFSLADESLMICCLG